MFIGSSAEGRDIARNLQVELGEVCRVRRWDQNVFEPSGFTLDSLITVAAEVDFAVLIATPDDTTISRGESRPSARDNVVLEFGLFAAALGRARTFLLATGNLKLPTDVLGLTRLPYHASPDPRAAVTPAALQLEERIRSLGFRTRTTAPNLEDRDSVALAGEVELICENAVAQGWSVKTNSVTTLRLRSPKGVPFTLQKGPARRTRDELRDFAAGLRGGGLRVNSSVRRPVELSPM